MLRMKKGDDGDHSWSKVRGAGRKSAERLLSELAGDFGWTDFHQDRATSLCDWEEITTDLEIKRLLSCHASIVAVIGVEC